MQIRNTIFIPTTAIRPIAATIGGKSRVLVKKILFHSYTDFGLLFLRLAFGITLAVHHGWGTFSTVANYSGFPDPVGLGPFLSKLLMGTSEFIFSLFVAAGFYCRLSVVPVILGFVVAFFIYHSDDPFGYKESAFLYGSAFFTLFLTGPGRYSIDHALFRKRNEDLAITK